MNTILTISLVFVFLLGCKKEPQQITEVIKMSESKTEAKAELESHCPVLSSRHWEATLSKGESGASFMLTVKGEVSMPTPGYSATFSEGPTDRMYPPSLRLHLTFSEPKQMVIQVVSPKKLTHTLDTSINKYRSVMVFCGEKLLAEIKDVTLDKSTI